MTRVLSGAILLAFAVAVVWLSPAAVFFGVAELLLVLGFVEYAALARNSGLPVPAIPACCGGDAHVRGGGRRHACADRRRADDGARRAWRPHADRMERRT